VLPTEVLRYLCGLHVLLLVILLLL
jgi:hypothetical protein